MALPNFLTASPPRSPHVAPPGYFDNMFPTATPSRSAFSIRPTRRDVLLCLLTMSFSYLLFSAPPSAETIASPANAAGAKSHQYLPWKTLWHSDESCAVPAATGSETTFTESVRGHGLQAIDESPKGDAPWDGGEEELEDDQVFPGETMNRGHQPGWTLFDRLYVYNGSFYVVTCGQAARHVGDDDEDAAVLSDPGKVKLITRHDRNDWPELRMMTSTGLPANNEPGNGEAREPKGHEITFISPYEAAKLWGPRVYRMEGMSWLFNDGQFIDHYYHYAAELLMGTWRTYASLDPDITAQGTTTLPPPRRMWFLHQNVNEWRDRPKFNPTIMSALFPSAAMLYPEDFADLARSTTSNLPNAFVLERALLADRSAAFRGPYTGPTARTVASAMHVGTTSRWWWEPIRRQVLRYSGVDEEIINRSLEGYGAVDPAGKALGPGVAAVEPLAPQGTYKPLVTYISRQNSRRRLTPESHADLVKALEERQKKLGFELVIVEAERITKEEQFALAARTTIMLGVHGNGLTHLLWMPATPRSGVIEMFFRGGFARDYQWTAHALGIRHFGVQYDETFTSPNIPEVAYPEGFQGEHIEVVGKVVADLIEDRLAGKAA